LLPKFGIWKKLPVCCLDFRAVVAELSIVGQRAAMNTRIIRFWIVAAMVLEFLWLVYLPAGNQLAPRSPEMAQALHAFETNRSAATEAAMWERVRRDDLRDWHRKEVLFSVLLLADAVFISFGIIESRKRQTNLRAGAKLIQNGS